MSADMVASRSHPAFRYVGWIIGCYGLAAVAFLPFARYPTPVMPGTTPFVMAGILVTDLSTSFLVYVWFRDACTWSLLLLANAYLYSGLMAVIHLLTFPNAVLPNQSVV